MPNKFTNFLRFKEVKKLFGEWTKKTADAIDAYNDPSERKIVINSIKLASPEKFITTHNYIIDMKNIIENKNKIHYGSASPIKPIGIGDKLFGDEKNIIDHIIDVIVPVLGTVYEKICLYQEEKTDLKTVYNKTKELYKNNKQYFDIVKSLKIFKIEDVDLLLRSNSFLEASRELNNSRLIDFEATAIEEINNAINICIEQLKKYDQLKISEYSNISAELEILIKEIDATKILNNNSDLNLLNNIENSEKKCGQLLRIFSYKLNLLNEKKTYIKSKEEYKNNTIFFEKTLPKLYKFYTDKFNKLKKSYQSSSGVFSQFKDSILFRNIIGDILNVKSIEESDSNNTEKIKRSTIVLVDELKINNYKSDKKLPKLYSKYQDAYNFLFGNKNKYTGKYKKLSHNNVSSTYDVSTHTKWSEIKKNSNNVKKKLKKYLKNKHDFLDKFKKCNDLMGNLKTEINKLMEQKNTILMFEHRLACFGSRETQKMITISLKGFNKYGKQTNLHIGYFFAYIYYVCSKLSEKNFTLLNKLLDHDSLQNMKSSFDDNSFEDSLLSKIKSKLK